MLKRIFDLVFSVVAIVILSPLMLIITIAIICFSQGSVIYRGERVGKNGVRFKILKFRTMVSDAESLGEKVTAKNDARVTGIGGFLRKLKLDELPQLINVLRGEMSIVGPRPEVEEYTNQYTEEEKKILSVKPGITDYASIEFVQLADAVGNNSNQEFFQKRIQDVLKRKNQLRLKYVYEGSFIVDLKIIFLTAVKLVKSI